MYEKYEDCYEEELEYEFIESLNKQILDYVNENLKAKLKDYENTKQENKEMIETFRRLKTEKQQAIFELEIAKKRDINDILNGYKIKDKVWVIDSKWNDSNCEKCNGKKKVVALIETQEVEINCPTCKGRGSRSLITYKPKEFRIDHIKIEINENNKYTITLMDYNYEKFKPADVYRTQEECQNVIDNNDKYKPRYSN